MRLLSRTIFREIFVSAILGASLFLFILFLRESRFLFGFLVRTSGSPSTVAYLFALVFPQPLPYTIPLGVLVGTLITLTRMSTDGEITAMRAAGVPGRRVVPPILMFGFLSMTAAAVSSLWLTPWSIREFYRVENQMLAHQLTADVEPRVFEEQFPNKILYINDVVGGTATSRWKRIFIADVTPPDQRKPGAAEVGDSPSIELASDALAVPDVEGHRIQLSLRGGITYETGKEPIDYHVETFSSRDQWVEAQKPVEVGASRPSSEMASVALYRRAYRSSGRDRNQLLDDRIEINRRLALPLACILLALVGIPLGVSTRRAGKSAAVVLTVAVAFLYYMGWISGISLARQGTLSPEMAVWLPNIVFAILGTILVVRLETPGDLDIVGSVMSGLRMLGRAPKHVPHVLDRIGPRAWLSRFPLLPQVIDTYVFASFLFYFILLLVSFILIFHVFEFFTLLADIIKNHPPMSRILTYHLFLSARLIYEFTPLSVLAAVLAVFGVMTKNNETTAFKACGVSLYRLAAPILIASVLMSGSLFAFDYYWVPDFDRRQDAIRNEIKGKPAQTYLRPDRKWVYGLHDRVYYYKYFDQNDRAMLYVNIYEIDPVHFRLKKHISAERARWEPAIHSWVFQNGWSVEMDTECAECPRKAFDNFAGQARTFPELEETPDYFVHEVVQSKQMNFQQLGDYIADLNLSGFDTVPLQVQLQEKFSVPLFALIMAMVSIPCAFATGKRGAMAGVGVSFAIAMVYLTVHQVFEQVGYLSQLPPKLAAWSPDAIFALAGLYLLARMRT